MPQPSDDTETDATPLAGLEAETAATLDELRSEARRAAEEAGAASTEREHLPAELETITLYLADLTHRGRAAGTWARLVPQELA
jgi:hypothetical protein